MAASSSWPATTKLCSGYAWKKGHEASASEFNPGKPWCRNCWAETHGLGKAKPGTGIKPAPRPPTHVTPPLSMRSPAAEQTPPEEDDEDWQPERQPERKVALDPTYFYESRQDREASDQWLALNEAGIPMHMLVTGPSGTGKTEGVKGLAARAGLPFYKVDCAAVTTPDKWIGHKEVDATGTHLILSDHLRWLQAQDCSPGLLLYDEITRIHPSQLNILIPILDGSRSIWVPDLNTHINVNPKTRIVATANIGGGFTGAFNFDVALHDRFGFVLERDFPPADEEAKILVLKTGVTQTQADTMVNIATRARLKTGDGSLSKPVSTRALLDMAHLVARGMSISDAADYTFVKKYSNEGGLQSERAMIRTIVAGKGT